MTADEFLKSQGYHCYGPDGLHYEKTVWGKRSRKRGLGLNVYKWDIFVPHTGRSYVSFEMGATFEVKTGEWIDLKYYSMTEKELRKGFKRKEKKLLAAIRLLEGIERK